MTADRKRVLEPRLTIRVREFFAIDDHPGNNVPHSYGYSAVLMPADGDWVRMYGPYETRREAVSKAHVVALAERAVVVE